MSVRQNKRLMFVLPLVLFVGLIAMLAMRLGKPTDIVTNTAMGRDLPAFNLPLLSDSNRMMTNEDLPKSPFILNVWGSWCPTCRVEHPFLMQLFAQKVPMVGINYKDEPADAFAYLNEHKDPFMYSIQDYHGTLAVDLGLTGAPESFVVDDKGRVRLHIVGELHEQNWANQIKPCLLALNDKTLDEMAKNNACQSV